MAKLMLLLEKGRKNMKKYIALNKEKIEIKTLTKFKDRFKSFRFYLKDIDHGLCFPKKKMLNTYFFCQKVDIIVTDKENNILAIYHDLKTEKFIRPRLKAYYIYVLKKDKALNLKEKDKLRIVTKDS
ncbi:MAG TPA: hypothetical protein IAB45_05265 [Candidatus Onthousia faecavium]|nr:hypothetical protein [Candidatus Onthousia faecavium]